MNKYIFFPGISILKESEVMLMNRKDLWVLALLRKDCRITLTDISRTTKIPISTLYDRLKNLDKSIIKRKAAMIDFSKIGFVVKSQVVFAVERAQKEEFANYLRMSINVNSLYRINNGYDYMAELLHRDLSELESFMDKLNSKFKIKDKKVFFIIEEMKKEEFLADDKALDLLEST